jgi:DNA ligase (NAD+)
MGPQIIDRFLDEGLISDASDIFTLQAGDIAVLERFGEKSAENLVKEIEEKRTVTLPRFLYALGILHVGEETANALAEHVATRGKVKTPLDVLRVMGNLSAEDLEEIPDIGPKVAASIHSWFHERTNAKLVERLDNAGIRLTYVPPPKGGPLEGQSFVFTGTLQGLTRGEAEALVRARGGDVSGSVSKKTNYVVAGEDPGSKYEKAKKLGVKTLTEAAFLKLVGRSLLAEEHEEHRKTEQVRVVVHFHDEHRLVAA